jgi:hypothetical protein
LEKLEKAALGVLWSMTPKWLKNAALREKVCRDLERLKVEGFISDYTIEKCEVVSKGEPGIATNKIVEVKDFDMTHVAITPHGIEVGGTFAPVERKVDVKA